MRVTRPTSPLRVYACLRVRVFSSWCISRHAMIVHPLYITTNSDNIIYSFHLLWWMAWGENSYLEERNTVLHWVKKVP